MGACRFGLELNSHGDGGVHGAVFPLKDAPGPLDWRRHAGPRSFALGWVGVATTRALKTIVSACLEIDFTRFQCLTFSWLDITKT